jgi:MFS family permease
MSTSSGGLWRHPDFLKLWAGQATSMFGSLIGSFAYSLVAIISLHASPGQIAVLNGCNLLPGIAAGPWAGVWADRLRRRPLLIAADLGRAVILGSIPLAALTQTLTMLQLYLVTVSMSVLTMFFGVSFQAYAPSVIGRERLIEGNSILRGTEAVAEAGGFALGGVLVQLLTAPIAIACDALSFLASALSLAAIQSTDTVRQHPARRGERPATRQDIMEGARAVWHDPVLRSLTMTTFVWEMVGSAIGVVIILFFVRDLHLQPLAMGPVFGIGGISAFLGALVASRVVRRWGLGRSLIGSLYFNNLGLLWVVVAGGPLPLILALLAAGQATDGGRTIYEINAVSLLQSRAPQGVVGRVFAVYETLKSSAMLLGLVAGGVLGAAIGLRNVLLLALLANLLVPLCLVVSPLRAIRGLGEESPAEGMVV